MYSEPKLPSYDSQYDVPVKHPVPEPSLYNVPPTHHQQPHQQPHPQQQQHMGRSPPRDGGQNGNHRVDAFDMGKSLESVY